MIEIPEIEALAFDVFGTVVDWRRSVSRQVAAVGAGLGLDKEWDTFADRWREGYHAGMDRVNADEDEWRLVDDIHRERLDLLLADFGMASPLSEEEKRDLNRAWHWLDPWPEAVEGLTRLRDAAAVNHLSAGQAE